MEGLIYAAMVIVGFCLAVCAAHIGFSLCLYLVYRHDGGRMKFSKYLKTM